MIQFFFVYVRICSSLPFSSYVLVAVLKRPAKDSGAVAPSTLPKARASPVAAAKPNSKSAASKLASKATKPTSAAVTVPKAIQKAVAFLNFVGVVVFRCLEIVSLIRWGFAFRCLEFDSMNMLYETLIERSTHFLFAVIAESESHRNI